MTELAERGLEAKALDVGLPHRLLRSPTGLAGVLLCALVAVLALAAPLVSPAGPFDTGGPSLAPPSTAHPLGTDALGRDVLSGVLFGARTSLAAAFAASTLALVLGLFVGTVSGYRGGRVDDALMRLTELFQTIPRFFFAIVVIALLGPGVDRLVLALGLTSWAELARVVRADVLSLKEREFVEAARAYGASGPRIVIREILPNVLPTALVLYGLVAASVILIEGSLGFLGLGDPNTVSWGLLAGQAQQFLRAAWWTWFFPGAAILSATLGLNLVIDAWTHPPGGHS